MKEFVMGILIGGLAVTVLTGRVKLGSVTWTVADLERKRVNSKRISTTVIGAVVIEKDVPPDLAGQVIESLHVVGAVVAPEPVRAALEGRLWYSGVLVS